MTEPKLPDESNPHAKWLREAAKQIAAAGHNGWGNTCLFAADEIDALRSELTSALALAAEREGEIERLKHNLLIETESGKQLGRFVRETDDERIDFRDKLIAADARAEAAEANDKRYRWLRDVAPTLGNRAPHVTQWPHQSFDDIEYPDAAKVGLDAAIDAMVKP